MRRFSRWRVPAGRREVYDPKTHKIDMIDLCFSTHHLQFDKNDILWFSSGGGNNEVIGWLDVKKWDATHDDSASQGWAPFILDTNGNGKRDVGWVEPKGKIGSGEGHARHHRAFTASARIRPTARCGARCWASRAVSFATIPRRS